MHTTNIQPFTSRAWYDLWWDVWTLPGTETFRQLLEESNGGAGRGFLWILLSGILSAVAYAVMMFFFPNISLSSIPAANRQMFQTFGAVGNFVCIPIASVIGAVITAGIYHGLARLFGGVGEWGRLVFCFAAIQSPAVLIALASSLPVSILSASKSPFVLPVAVFSILFSLVLSIYTTALYVFALKATENIGTGKALTVILLPGVLGLALVGCLFGGLIATYINQLPLK